MLPIRSLKIVLPISGAVIAIASVAAALTPQDPAVRLVVPKPTKIVDLGPGGILPRVGQVRGLSKDGKFLELEEREFLSRLERRVVEFDDPVERGGKLVTNVVREERTLQVPAAGRPQVVRYALGQVRVYDLEGRRIPSTKVAALFYKPRLILWTPEGQKVDPEYLLVAREETPFVVLPNNDPLVAPSPSRPTRPGRNE